MRQNPSERRATPPPSVVPTLALAFLLCLPVDAKQPTPSETGPRIYRCDVRYVRHRRRIYVPVILVDGEWQIPGDWTYTEPDHWEGIPPHFYRKRWNNEKDIMLPDTVETVGGLWW
jgi:hypothetical protein